MAGLGCPQLVCMLLYFFFFCVVLVSHGVLVHGQSTDGFISIDCGIADGSGYQDPDTKIYFSPDSPYIDAGESKNVLENTSNQPAQYRNVRSFPIGSRNCYSLWPVKVGGKYLVRAGFWYGNYDGKNSIPVFDLHIGVNFWITLKGLSSHNGGGTWEIITVATADSIEVCLVNTGNGTPFISTLHLRPLPGSLYSLADHTRSLALHPDRRNYGTSSFVAYPDDPYDRFWFGYVGSFTTLTSTPEVTAMDGDGFHVPSSVLRTAVTIGCLNRYIKVVWVNISPGEKVHAILHFAEVEQLTANETRKMDIYEGEGRSGRLLCGNCTFHYAQADAREVNATVGEGGTYSLSIYASASSTRPPIINADELFLLRPMAELPTDHRDVDAIQDIKRVYNVKRNWMGDPCAPKKFVWDGVNCSYEAFKPPRIIYLNLTSSGLSNGIAASISNLTALTALDLSNNNLTGTIPDFLASLSSLKIFIEGIPEHCSQIQKRKKTSIHVALVSSIIFIVLLLISILLWRIKRRQQFNASNDRWKTPQKDDFLRHILKENDGLKRESLHFTVSEIKHITKNFETTIGKGGFGTVYLGYLNEKTKVAVKVLSESSSQGTKEFQAEAILLTRVHHKNLVSLLGYCDVEHNLALVYEYMDQGNLRDHLSDNTNIQSWQERVKIVLQAAQGLDYLHSGCKPPIIHRDVKSANILLSHNSIAKLSDFGLSRVFDNENFTHISTGIAGTPGYLDPEYHETYRLNEKSDVYSFGIVLLEIITGQPPFLNLSERIHIVKWVRSRIECGDTSNIVDHRLGGSCDTDSIWKVLEIAMACTSTTSAQRLNMSNVVTRLKECLAPEATHDVPSWDSVGTLSSEEISSGR